MDTELYQTDEECLRALAEQKADALKPLFSRYAPLVFHLASQSLDPASAEDIVQDVFLSLWTKAGSFDASRGAFRPWLLQIAHSRILNELRARSRRPAPVPQEDALDGIPDPRHGPAEASWQAYRRDAVREAVGRLPPHQRQALSLAFFQDLTHDQVAAALRLPLGTVKSRIRSAVQKLRFILAPLGVAAVALAVLIGAAVRIEQQRLTAMRDDRALAFATASDITTLHVPAAPGVDPAVHGSYRGRPGTPLAILAIHSFPPAPAGKSYQAWVLSGGTWTSLGIGTPDTAGDAVIVAEGAAFRALPDAVRVTVEPRGGSRQPSGPVIIEWQAH